MMEKGYPALVLEPTWQEKMEKRLAESKTYITEAEKELKIHKGLHKTQMELLFGFCERDVIIFASEILKWSIKKRGKNDGEGHQLFDSDSEVKRIVLLGCRAYREFESNPNRRHVKDFKDMSQVVIKARNSTIHFQDLKALERMVKSYEIAIKEWPEFEAKHPTQVKIIGKYKAFKQHLPKCFY